MRYVFLVLVLLTFLASPTGAVAQAPVPGDPVLEEYGLSFGGDAASPSAGIHARIVDMQFGNGDAKSLLVLKGAAKASTLQLKVWRRVKPGEISFALLVFRVEIRGFDSTGAPVFSKDLPGFTFGDSSSGLWSKTLPRLPLEAVRIQVKFVGNYE